MRNTRNKRMDNNVRGEPYEIISIMAILSCLALERRFTPQTNDPSAVVGIYKDKKFLRYLKNAYRHDKDLSVLARDFGTFIRVIERAAHR